MPPIPAYLVWSVAFLAVVFAGMAGGVFVFWRLKPLVRWEVHTQFRASDPDLIDTKRIRRPGVIAGDLLNGKLYQPLQEHVEEPPPETKYTQYRGHFPHRGGSGSRHRRTVRSGDDVLGRLHIRRSEPDREG